MSQSQKVFIWSILLVIELITVSYCAENSKKVTVSPTVIHTDSRPLIDPIDDDYDALSFEYNAKRNRVNRIRKRLPAAEESSKGFDISPEIRINENA